jgi:glycosyltransferase involved in cell wall biosynthesis
LTCSNDEDAIAFLICGNRNGDSDGFAALYAGKGLDAAIRFGGYRNDIKEIFYSSFCGVLPTTGWESLTQTSLEMAACGLPIVASRLQGLTEAVLDGETGVLFTPSEPRELADALENLLDHPQQAAELGRNARLRCLEEFTLDRQHARYLAVLRRRVARSRTS